MQQTVKTYLRQTGALLLGIVVALACIRYSAYIGIPTYLAVDWVFPAISTETINTTTTNGLTPPIHNLAFLIFALLTGSMTTAMFWPSNLTFKREEITCTISFSVLCFISSVNFWPREQLLQMHAQALIDFTLAAITIYVLARLRHIKPASTALQTGKLSIVLCTAVFGLALPAVFGSIALVAGFGVPVGDAYQYRFWLVVFAVLAGILLTLRNLKANPRA